MSDRRRLLLTLLNQGVWLPYSFEYLYHDLIPTTIDSKQVKNKLKLATIYGNSVVENQLVENGNFESTSGWFTIASSGSLSVANNIAKVEKISNSKVFLYRANASYPTLTNHKYLHTALVRTSHNATLRFTCCNLYMSYQSIIANSWTRISFIASPTTFGGFFSDIEDNNDLPVGGYFETREYEVIDLTQRYPFDTPTTLTDNRVQALLNRGYIPYNSGELNSVDIGEFSSEPYNLLSLDRTKGTLSGYGRTTPRNFDLTKYYVGMSRDGYYDEPNISSITINNGAISFHTNLSGFGIAYPIKVKPNMQYTLSASVVADTSGHNTGLGIGYYDENGLNIGYTQSENQQENKSVSFITPSNCVLVIVVLFSNQNINLTTYSNISFHRTGTRTGYAEHTDPQTISLKYQGNGVGTSHDTMEITDTEWVFTKNVGVVDLGTIDWLYNYTYDKFYVSGLSYILMNSKNLLCSRYITVDPTLASTEQVNKSIATRSNIAGYLYIKDTSYTDPALLKAALSGVYLYYELATPQVITIPRKKLGVVDLGTLTWVYDGADGRFYSRSIYFKPTTDGNVVGNIYCERFISTSNNAITFQNVKNAISIAADGNLIKCQYGTGNDATAFKNFVSGLYLFYETKDEVADIIDTIGVEAGGTFTSDSEVLPNVYTKIKGK